jgi:hypothetical protein
MAKGILKIILVFVLTASWGLLFNQADASKKQSVCVKDGVEYGKVKGAFRNNWWNYQERGMSYADGECFEAALPDIEEAIKQRDKLVPKKQLVQGHACDQRRARTYGMHFVDYFGHRERGVVLFRTGLIDEAEKELEYSLSCTESSKAQYFLDKVRETRLRQTQADKLAPTLEITSFQEKAYTNQLEVTIAGTARDDQFVKEILINGSPVLIPLADKEITFSQKLELSAGPNQVEIVVRDLLGKSVSKTLSIHVDRAGPQLSLEDIRRLSMADYIEVRGLVSDVTGIKEFTLNQSPVTVRSGSGEFVAQVKLGGKDKIEFKATDSAGNTTAGTIHLGPRPKGAAISRPVKYAALGYPGVYSPLSDPAFDPEFDIPFGTDSWLEERSRVAENDLWWNIWDTYAAMRDDEPPVIKLKDLIAEQTVYFNQIYLEGNVSDMNPITQLTINNKPIVKGERKNIFFNFIFKLRPGKNLIRIQAMDSKGNVAEKTIRVMRIVPKVHQINSRMSMSMLPFYQEEQFKEIGPVAYENLLTAIVDQERFSMVDRSRIEAVLNEMRLSAEGLTDQTTTIKVGKLTAAEGIIMGLVRETPSSIEVYARLVDVESSEILMEKDAFHEDKSLSNLQFLMQGLALKLKNGFPILEGQILSQQGDSFTINLGSNHLIKPGMRVIVFKEEKMIQPETGMVLGIETEQLAEAKVVEVYDRMSKIEPIKDKITAPVVAKNLIITK